MNKLQVGEWGKGRLADRRRKKLHHKHCHLLLLLFQGEELEEVGERRKRTRWGENMEVLLLLGRRRGWGGSGGEKGEGVDGEEGSDVGGEGGSWGGHLGFMKTPFLSNFLISQYSSQR